MRRKKIQRQKVFDSPSVVMFTLTFAGLLLGLGFQTENASVLLDGGLDQMVSCLQKGGTVGKALFMSHLVLVS